MRNLMSMSVTSRKLRGARILIYSKCIEEEYPKVLSDFSRDFILLGVCMEELHMDCVGFKIMSIIRFSKPEKIAILTMDGSPHCIQLHFLGEHIGRVMELSEEFIDHYVIEKGELIKVPREAIRIARHLSQCAKLLKTYSGGTHLG